VQIRLILFADHSYCKAFSLGLFIRKKEYKLQRLKDNFIFLQMAGGEKFLFPHEISSYNAVDWSEDANIAIATDGGILILVFRQYNPIFSGCL
jgi:hypothetical protein